MSVPYLNNIATQDGYVDGLTVEFGRPRPAFSMNVHNAAIYYRLAIFPPGGQRGIDWEPGEHYLAPSLNSFDSPAEEGFPPGSGFAGIAIRSAVASTPANVSVA